jgi:hypothetical protein
MNVMSQRSINHHQGKDVWLEGSGKDLGMGFEVGP